MSAYKRHILELHLKKIVLDLPAYAAASGEHGLLVSLIAPRPTIAERSAQRTLHLTEGVFSTKGQAFHETVLFKETVQGPFGLRVALTEQADMLVLGNWLADLSDYALRSAGSWLAADVPSFLRTLSQRPFRLAGEEVNPRSSPVRYTGAGGIGVEDSSPSKRQRLSIDLFSPEDMIVSHPVSRPAPRGRGAARRTPIRSSETIAAGTRVGQLDLSLLIV